MKFGIFEHLDDSGIPVGLHFNNRLSLIEACDRYGFYAYHLAEHHGTPLGLAPSPGQAGSAFAGTVAGFETFLKDQIRATGATYFVCDVAFGDLTPEEKVMPQFSDETSSVTSRLSGTIRSHVGRGTILLMTSPPHAQRRSFQLGCS